MAQVTDYRWSTRRVRNIAQRDTVSFGGAKAVAPVALCTYSKTSDSASMYRGSCFARSLSNGGRGGGSWLPEACLIARRWRTTSCLRFFPAGISQRLSQCRSAPLIWLEQRHLLLLVRHTHSVPLSPLHKWDRDTFSVGTALHASDAVVGARMSPTKLSHECPFHLQVRLPRQKQVDILTRA